MSVDLEKRFDHLLQFFAVVLGYGCEVSTSHALGQLFKILSVERRVERRQLIDEAT
jgi:hypothetical protein